jgi:thiamine transport system substrate-binding protein
VATYPAYLDAPSVSPGGWVKEQFESTHDATLEWVSPEGGINYFIQRRQQNRPIEADVYLGLTVEELVRVDRELGTNADSSGGGGNRGGLFAPAETEPIANYDAIKSKLEFDSANRVIPVGTSYVSLVYDESAIEAPSTFADLLEPAYEGALIAENPTQGATGLRFLLQSIAARGEDGYLNYWSELLDNGTTVLGSWSDSYAAYSNGEAPMVVSYSTDQVFAERAGEDLSQHQVAFLDDGAVPYTDGIATFEETDETDLANTFASFMLSPRVQTRTAVLNVGLPAVTNATLPKDFQQLVAVPEEAVEFSYDRLRGNLQGWVEAWSRQVAGR